MSTRVAFSCALLITGIAWFELFIHLLSVPFLASIGFDLPFLPDRPPRGVWKGSEREIRRGWKGMKRSGGTRWWYPGEARRADTHSWTLECNGRGSDILEKFRKPLVSFEVARRGSEKGVERERERDSWEFCSRTMANKRKRERIHKKIQEYKRVGKKKRVLDELS